MDPLWHSHVGPVQFTRELDVPCINVFQKPSWRLTQMGIIACRQDKFIIAHNTLQQLDYFPERGDKVVWNGYRYVILNVVIDPEAYWQQTQQWMGLTVECVVPPEGDSTPVIDAKTLTPSEKSTAFQKLSQHREA